MNQKNSLVLFLLISCWTYTFQLQAQASKGYQKGYYISFKGDSITGYFKYNPLAPPPGHVLFKEKANAKNYSRVNPLEVKYMVIAEQYILKSRAFQKGVQEEYIFLQRIAKSGKVELYEGLNRGGNPARLFFLQKNGELIFIPPNGLANFVQKAFADCALVQENKTQYRYNQKRLYQLMQDASQCDATMAEVIIYKPETGSSFHIGAAATFSSGFFDLPGYYAQATDLNFSHLGFGLLSEYRKGNWAMGLGLYYDKAKSERTNVALSNNQASNITDIRVDINKIQLMLVAKRYFNLSSFNIIPEAGFAANFLFNSELVDVHSLFPTFSGIDMPVFYQQKNFGIGIVGGLAFGIPLKNGLEIQPGARFVWAESEFKQVPKIFSSSNDVYEKKGQVLVRVLYK